MVTVIPPPLSATQIFKEPLSKAFGEAAVLTSWDKEAITEKSLIWIPTRWTAVKTDLGWSQIHS